MNRLSLFKIALAAGLAGALSPAAIAQKAANGFVSMQEIMEHRMTEGARTRVFSLSHDEYRAFKKIRAALDVKNYEGAAAAIAQARTAAHSEDARYAFAALQLELGLATRDVPLQNRAVEAVLASGAASNGNDLKLQRRHGMGAIWEADYEKAEEELKEYMARTPDKVDAMILLAETAYRANRHREALALLDEAIAMETAAKRPIPARWLRARQTLIPSARDEPATGIRPGSNERRPNPAGYAVS